MAVETKVTEANKGPILTPSKFKNYDMCINPYVGCQFGCKYCYVRFFVKDKEKDWGEFVRIRQHMQTKLPKELHKAVGKRIVIGTMTDPYQPQERKSRITRAALQAILALPEDKRPSKVGIYTRSPFVLDDIDLIKQLPRVRVHYTVTPYEQEILAKIEPIPVPTAKRLDAVKKLKAAGIRMHVNIAPVIPYLSEKFTDEFAQAMTDCKVDEFFVDPMQPYKEAMAAIQFALQGDAIWEKVRDTMTIRENYDAWKEEYRKTWFAAWQKYGNPATFGIWSDHQFHVYVNMATGEQLDERLYGDDLQASEAEA